MSDKEKMKKVSSEPQQRVICVGGVGADSMLTDLLYYDAVLCSPLSIICHSVEDHQKLIEAGLIVDCGELFGEAELAARRSSFVQHFAANRDKITPEVLLEVFDEDVRRFAMEASDEYMNVVPKYTSNVFPSIYKPGSNDVMSIIYSCLPAINPFENNINVDDLVGFLNDEETIIKKRRLFAWQNNLETRVEKGEVKVEHIPDLIATLSDDYTAWLKKSGLKLKYEKREIVFYFLSSLLTAIRIPDAIKELFEFKKRKVDLLDDEKAPGRELAYIVHAKERVSEDK